MPFSCLSIFNVAPIHTPTKREGPHEKGRGYANAAIRFMRAKGYMLEDRADDSGTFSDLKFGKKLSDEEVLAEAKNTTLNFTSYQRDLARYFIKCFHNDYIFYLFADTLDGDEWETIFEEPERNKEDIVEFFEELQEETDGDLGDELEMRHPDHFLDFVTTAEIWEYSLPDLIRVSERAERTKEYDDQPYIRSYPPIREPVEISSNLVEIINLPKTLYRIDAIEDLDTAKYYNYNPEYLPVHPHGGFLYSLLEPETLPESTAYYIQSGTAEELDFEDWATNATTEEENTAKHLLRKVIALGVRNKDCRADGASNGTLLYAIYDPELHGEDGRTYQNKWIAQPLNHRSEIRHRAVWLSVKKFSGSYYYTLRPTDVFTYNGKDRVSGRVKSDLASSFSDSKFPQNQRKLRTIEMWASLLVPSQAGFQHFEGEEEKLIPALTEMSLRHVTGFRMDVRPPHNKREQREIIRGVKGQPSSLEEYHAN